MQRARFFLSPSVFLFFSLLVVGSSPCRAAEATKTSAVSLPLVDRMPDLPSPYRMRDWRQVTLDYLDLVLDPGRTGPLLPLMRPNHAGSDAFFLPSYVGGDGPEAINCLAAVVSGSRAGLDMTRYRGRDWVRGCQVFYSKTDGVYTNNIGGRTGGSFWYEIYPNLLFYQLCDRYPNAERREQMHNIAEQWYTACVKMGGGKTPPPDFDHTAFRFQTLAPVDNGRWIEPDAAAGIAWLEYLDWVRSKNPRSLTAADWCLRAMERRPQEKNPLYEVLLPYGALIAARMNAELERDYDEGKLLDWCFTAGDRRTARWGWGVISDRFGDQDCQGLAGSVIDTDGYAFTMNTFEWAGALTPIARYDVRYARSIGKWMLNLTNAARLFYPNGLPADHQDDRAWSEANDPRFCIAYEGLRKQALRYSLPHADLQLRRGVLRSGSFAAARRQDGRYEVLEGTQESGGLEQIWEFDLPSGRSRALYAHLHASSSIKFQFAPAPEGPYADLFTVPPGEADVDLGAELKGLPEAAGKVLVRAVSEGACVLSVDSLRINSLDPAVSPFATGDTLANDAPSNLCLYGSSHVGALGGIVARTDVEKILQLDLLQTDAFHNRAYPTYLYYNPYSISKRVTIALGSAAKDLYDAVSHRFLKRKVRGRTALLIPARAALVVVEAPANGKQMREGRKLRIDGVVVDYRD